MTIQTDSKSIESPKDTESCNVFNIYKLLASEEQVSALKQKYEEGNFGYGQAKQELFEVICKKFKSEREKFNHLIENREIIESELNKGVKKARTIAREVLQRVRQNIGYFNG